MFHKTFFSGFNSRHIYVAPKLLGCSDRIVNVNI